MIYDFKIIALIPWFISYNMYDHDHQYNENNFYRYMYQIFEFLENNGEITQS